ncbi:MAG: histidine ammonia-lyase [Deltaproteobacteria bacterium]|nr:histidine ammonia-lyase [Deltaproteobacteria bacterium]
MVRVGEPLGLDELEAVAAGRARVECSPRATRAMEASRAAVMEAVGARGGEREPIRVYGVNTGFGALSEVAVSRGKIRALQRNLVRSHACGVGPALPTATVRAMMLLRAQVLALGHSGVRPAIVDLLCRLLNRGVHPIIPEQGSVGASGDLAPLAHLALVLIGEGRAEHEGRVMSGRRALARARCVPIELREKEGLALINGTQLMTARAAEAVRRGADLCRVADVAGAMSIEALEASHHPFERRVHAIRPHLGQGDSAANMRKLLAASQIVRSHRHCGKVQDAYSLRCIPQVHGATRDALGFVRAVVERELGAVTDNPLVFARPRRGQASFVSAGNFHGQPLSLCLDVAAIAVASLANISERRIEQLVNPAFSGLPPFLATETGLDSGFMLAQVTAAALVAENKVLAHPASVDSIPSSAGKEDHVSMGATAARKAIQVIEHVGLVLGIELMVAAQALDLRAPLLPGRGVAAAHRAVRSVIARLEGDRVLAGDIAAAAELVSGGGLLAAVTRAAGSLR